MNGDRIKFSEICNHTNPIEHFLCETLSSQQFKDIISLDLDGIIEFKLTINGHEVPFISSLKKIYELFESDTKQRAAELAYSTAKIDGLDDLRKLIERCDLEIREKIETTFNVKLGD